MADLSHHTRRVAPGVRHAARAGLGLAAAGLMFLVVSDLWISTCTGSLVDAAGCGAPQKAMLTLGPPALMLAGGAWSLIQGQRARQEPATKAAWLIAGWALVALAVICAVLSLPMLPSR